MTRILCFLLLSVFFTGCEKYTYTPLYPTPPAGYYDEINIGTVYNGNLIVAGNFTALFGSANNIAQWNGSSWQSLGGGLSSYGNSLDYGNAVSAMAVYNNNLIVAGRLDNVNGQPAGCIAEWNGSSWQMMGGGITSAYYYYSENISALAVYNGTLIAGGNFESIGGVPAVNIAQWNGSSWQSLGGGTNVGYGGDNEITSLAVVKGNLFACGYFNTIGGANANGLAQWNGSTWLPILVNKNGYPGTIFNYDSNLVVLGTFDSIGSIEAYDGAIFNGISWAALNLPGGYLNISSPIVYNNSIYFINPDNSDSAMYAWNTSSVPTMVGSCTSTKERWSEQNIRPNIYPLCIYNGNLITGGWFTSVNGVSSNYNLAKWNGSNWSSFP